MTRMQAPKRHAAPSSAGARATRSSRTRRRCSTRCCRSSRSISRARARRSRALFRRVDEVRLEIGFGGGEHLIAEAERHPRTGFIGSEPFVNGMAKALAAIDEPRPAISGCISATRPNCSPGCRRLRSRASICSIPIRGRSGGTGSAASCRTKASARSRAVCARRRVPLRHRHRGLCRLDAGALRARRISHGPPNAPTTGACRGRASRHALRGQGQARRPRAVLSDFRRS